MSVIIIEELKRQIDNLEFGEHFTKLEAIINLGKIGDESGVLPLIEVLENGTKWMKEDAAVSLGLIGDHRASNILIKNLKLENICASRCAESLAKIGCKKSIKELNKQLKISNTDTKIISIIWSLGHLGAKNSVDTIRTFLNNDNRVIKYSASQALKKLE